MRFSTPVQCFGLGLFQLSNSILTLIQVLHDGIRAQRRASFQQVGEEFRGLPTAMKPKRLQSQTVRADVFFSIHDLWTVGVAYQK